MTKTTNYQLNQWEKTDRILMEDFNADNAKVDAALKGQAEALAAEQAAREAGDAALAEKSTPQVLKTVTQPADSTLFTVDLSDIDWNQWRNVYICLEVSGNGYYYSAYGSTYKNNESHQIPGKHCLVLWPMYQANSSVGGVFFGYNMPVIVGPCIPYTQFTSYTAVCPEDSYTIKAGSKITVLGEK